MHSIAISQQVDRQVQRSDSYDSVMIIVCDVTCRKRQAGYHLEAPHILFRAAGIEAHTGPVPAPGSCACGHPAHRHLSLHAGRQCLGRVCRPPTPASLPCSMVARHGWLWDTVSEPSSAENGLFCMNTALPCSFDTRVRHCNVAVPRDQAPCRATRPCSSADRQQAAGRPRHKLCWLSGNFLEQDDEVSHRCSWCRDAHS